MSTRRFYIDITFDQDRVSEDDLVSMLDTLIRNDSVIDLEPAIQELNGFYVRAAPLSVSEENGEMAR